MWRGWQRPGQEWATAHLIIQALVIEGDVEGEGGRVVMWPQRGLFVRPVADHEVHYCPGLWGRRRRLWGRLGGLGLFRRDDKEPLSRRGHERARRWPASQPALGRPPAAAPRWDLRPRCYGHRVALLETPPWGWRGGAGDSGSHLGVVAGEQALSHGSHVRPQQLQPLVLVAHLLHVDVDGGHVLVAPSQPRVLWAVGTERLGQRRPPSFLVPRP